MGENLTWRGHSIKLKGKRWHDIKDQLHRDLVDVQVEVEVKKQSRLGRRSKITKIWRMVGIKNAETGEYHWYLTNMPTEMVSAQDVAKIYALRWQIELFFKTLKTHARARNLKSQNEWVMEAMLWAAMILSLINVALRQAVTEHLPENQRKRVPWLRWCEVVATFAGEILDEIFGFVRSVPLWPLLCRQALDPNLCRSNTFSFLPS